MKIGWATDVHLSHAREHARKVFYDRVRESEAEALLITGDIAEAQTVVPFLNEVYNSTGKKVYFVLGNHDYYGGRGGIFPEMDETRAAVSELGESMVYLAAQGVVELSPDTGLVGHDGWYDGEYANFYTSKIDLNDFNFIRGLAWQIKKLALDKCVALAHVGADHILSWGEEALRKYSTVVIATHVPPFPQCATFHGKQSDEHWLPWMTSKATGDALRTLSVRFPDKKIIVFCGHSHGGSVVEVRHNLTVHTGAAEYKMPALQGVWEF